MFSIGQNLKDVHMTYSFPFFYLTKKLRQNLNNLRTKIPFMVKRALTIFKGLSVAKNCLRPESVPLSLFLL